MKHPKKVFSGTIVVALIIIALIFLELIPTLLNTDFNKDKYTRSDVLRNISPEINQITCRDRNNGMIGIFQCKVDFKDGTSHSDEYGLYHTIFRINRHYEHASKSNGIKYRYSREWLGDIVEQADLKDKYVQKRLANNEYKHAIKYFQFNFTNKNEYPFFDSSPNIDMGSKNTKLREREIENIVLTQADYIKIRPALEYVSKKALEAKAKAKSTKK